MSRKQPFTLDKGPSRRPARFAQRIREELTMLVPHSLHDPRLRNIPFITITEVTVTPDLKHAKILFALMGRELNDAGEKSKQARSIEDALNEAAPFLRKELMYKLESKVTPQLKFVIDLGLGYSDEIAQLLRTIK